MNKDFQESINFPIVYKFPQFMRFFTLIIATMIIIFSLFVVFTQISSDSSTFKKILPFLIMFLSTDSLVRNLFSLNKVTIIEEGIIFSSLAKRNLFVKWKDIVKLETYQVKGKYFVLHYHNSVEDNQVKKHYFPMAFNNIIEIVNYIVHLSVEIETDEFVKSLVFLEPNKEKK